MFADKVGAKYSHALLSLTEKTIRNLLSLISLQAYCRKDRRNNIHR